MAKTKTATAKKTTTKKTATKKATVKKVVKRVAAKKTVAKKAPQKIANNKSKIAPYKSKKNAPLIDYSKNKFHKKNNYWLPIKPSNNTLVIEKNSFYILKSSKFSQ